MLKTVIALIAGFAIMTFTIVVAAVVTAMLMEPNRFAPTPAFLAIGVAYSSLAAAFGGYATAALAPDRPSAHTAVLAVMVMVYSASNYLTPRAGQEPFHLALLIVLGPAFALAGGKLRVLQQSRREQAEPPR